jgi:hypothetical protein
MQRGELLAHLRRELDGWMQMSRRVGETERSLHLLCVECGLGRFRPGHLVGRSDELLLTAGSEE